MGSKQTVSKDVTSRVSPQASKSEDSTKGRFCGGQQASQVTVLV
jgi:hypothetical protein